MEDYEIQMVQLLIATIITIVLISLDWLFTCLLLYSAQDALQQQKLYCCKVRCVCEVTVLMSQQLTATNCSALLCTLMQDLGCVLANWWGCLQMPETSSNDYI